jgi:hypothetical protein
MDISRSGSRPVNQGAQEWFTGDVHVEQLFQAREPARALGASVTSRPGRELLGIATPLARRSS